MTTGITAALVVTAALGATFRTTRQIGIAACAALCFMHWWLSVFVLLALFVAWKRMKR